MNYLKISRVVSIIFSIFMLAGCSFLSPVKTGNVNKYFINKVPCNVPVKKSRPIVLLVPMPEVQRAYDTTLMAYSVRPYEISYYALNQWAESPGEMLQPLLVQTMEDTHHFKAVVTPPYNGRYDYILNTTILELLQDYTHCMPLFHLTVRVQIIKASTNRVIGTRQFSVIQPIPQRSPYAGVFAANHAAVCLLQQIAAFSLERIP
jgi:cholesterol transport system auxiliary component